MNSLKYLGYGLLAKYALKAYFRAPRETIQDELFNLHRWALKKAHTARMANEQRAMDQYEVCACGHPASLNLGGTLYCSACFAEREHQRAAQARVENEKKGF